MCYLPSAPQPQEHLLLQKTHTKDIHREGDCSPLRIPYIPNRRLLGQMKASELPPAPRLTLYHNHSSHNKQLWSPALPHAAPGHSVLRLSERPPGSPWLHPCSAPSQLGVRCYFSWAGREPTALSLGPVVVWPLPLSGFSCYRPYSSSSNPSSSSDFEQ